MKKIIYLLCVCLVISLFTGHAFANEEEGEENGYEYWELVTDPRLRFEGRHERDGEFYLVKDSDPARTLIEATHLSVRWENGSGIVKYFTKKDGSQLRIVKNPNNGDYVEIQAVPIDTQTVTLTKDCMGHKVPLEYHAFETGEIIKAGTYQVNKIGVGWIGIVKEDGTNVWVNPNRDRDYNYVSGKFTFFESDVQTLSVSQINGIPVNTSYMIPNYNRVVRPGYSNVPLYVTIHNTANTSNGADALAHAQIQYNRRNSADIWTSWHFQVDDHSIYQSVPMDEVAWHAGDGSMMGNGNTIAIEICENNDGNYAQAERNAAYLTAQILYENGMPRDAIRKHGDWSGKNCPHNINDGTKGTMGWEAFVQLVGQIYDQLAEKDQEIEEIPLSERFSEYLSKTDFTYDQNLLYGVGLETSIPDFIDMLQKADQSAQIKVMNQNNEDVKEGFVGTNFKAKVVLGNVEENNTEEFIFTLAIPFDINSDGRFNALDYRSFTYYMLDKRKYALNYAQRAGADLNHKQGEKINVNALDYRQMTYAMLK